MKKRIQKYITDLGKVCLTILMILTTLNLGGISNTFAANAENVNSCLLYTSRGTTNYKKINFTRNEC